MLLGEVVDELLNQDCLANACAAEQTGLTTTNIGLEKVDGLDAGLEDLGLGGDVLELRSRTVNRVKLHVFRHGHAINRLASDVPDAAKGLRTDGHHHRGTRVVNTETALKAVGGGHGDATNDVTRKQALDLKREVDGANRGLALDGKGVVDRGDVVVELNVDDGAHDADDSAVSDTTVLDIEGRLLEHRPLLSGF